MRGIRRARNRKRARQQIKFAAVIREEFFMRVGLTVAVLGCILLSPAYGAEIVEKGTVHFEPRGDQQNVPERYRLAAHSFDYEMERKQELPASGVDVFRVRFPSPVVSPHAENNTVHSEYYRPKGQGPFPGVV